MIRADMISTVGREYLASNIENDEYSYPKAFAAQSLTFNPIRNKAGRAFERLDIRFVKDKDTKPAGFTARLCPRKQFQGTMVSFMSLML